MKQAEKTEHGEKSLHSGNYTFFIRKVGGMLAVHGSMTLLADYLCHLNTSICTLLMRQLQHVVHGRKYWVRETVGQRRDLYNFLAR